MITIIRAFVLILLLTVSGCGGKSKEELFAEGMKQAKTNPNGALILFKSALEKDSNFIDARYQMSKAYVAMGKFEQAEKEFQKVLRQDPSRIDVKLELAKVYIGMKKPDEAVKEATAYLQVKPDSPDALETLANAYAAQNKPELAEEYLAKVLVIDPKRASAKLQLAIIFQFQRKDGEARRLIGEVIKEDPANTKAYYLLAAIESSQGRIDQALELYKKISETDSKDSTALYKAGIIYMQRGDLSNADKVVASLIQKFPKGADGPRLKGIINYTRKNYNDAITDLQTSLKFRPTVEGYYFLGLAMFGRGDLESALSQFRRILDNNPDYSRARILVATILLKQQRVDDAIKEAQKVIETDPKSALGHNLLGSAYLTKGMYDDGMKELQKATELDPRIVDAHVKKGVFHLAKGKVQEAETDLSTAVKVAPELLNTRLLLAAFHQRNGNYSKAISVINQGLTGKPADAPLFNYLAGLMFAQNKPAEGLSYLDKAKKVDPTFFAAYANTANYYATKGDYDKALAEYQVVLAKDQANVLAMLSTAALLELKGRDADAYKWYRKAADSKNDKGYLALATYHIKKKETGKALSVLDEAIKSIPRNVPALEAKGALLLSEKKYKDAIKTYGDIQSINPERAQLLKVNAYVAAKDYSKALNEARWFVTQKPNSAEGYLLVSAVYQSQNDLDRAMTEIKNALRVDPNSSDAAVKLGNIYTIKKDYNSAISSYNEAIRKRPDNPGALFALGEVYDTLGKKKEAVRKYQESIAKSDKFIPAINNLAYLYAEGYGKPQEALSLALTGYKLDPGNPVILDTLGYSLLKNRRLDDAQKALEKAASMLPDNPVVSYHLALVYKDKGNNDLAIKSLQKALAKGDFPEAGNAKKLVNEMKR